MTIKEILLNPKTGLNYDNIKKLDMCKNCIRQLCYDFEILESDLNLFLSILASERHRASQLDDVLCSNAMKNILKRSRMVLFNLKRFSYSEEVQNNYLAKYNNRWHKLATASPPAS